jgi:hypothetical protein
LQLLNFHAPGAGIPKGFVFEGRTQKACTHTLSNLRKEHLAGNVTAPSSPATGTPRKRKAAAPAPSSTRKKFAGGEAKQGEKVLDEDESDESPGMTPSPSTEKKKVKMENFDDYQENVQNQEVCFKTL